MPTFDFANIVRKIISAAVAAASSPITSTVAIAALLTPFISDILTFFSDSFTLPTFTLPQITTPAYSGQLMSLLFYAVNFDLAIDVCNTILSILTSVISFVNRFIVSLLSVIVVSSTYKIIRKALKDYAG